MRIGIDISQTVYPGGVSIYTRNLVQELLRIDRENQYVFFFASLRQHLDRQLETDIRTSGAGLRKWLLPTSALEFLWNRAHIVPLEWLAGRVDIFHASDWTQPPSKKARVVTTIHDLSFLRWPETVPAKILAVQKRRLRWVKQEAAMVIAVSRATKEEIKKLLRIEEERLRVVYEGVPRDAATFKVKEGEQKQWQKKYRLSRPYFLAYGSMAPRKNIARLMEAFAGNHNLREKAQLVIVGNYAPEQKLPPGVVLTGFLPRQAMLTLFSAARALIYPSLYEGFGLPILEAFALGVPVITSSLSSMAEIAGRAALLVDPYSAEQISKAMEQILEDAKLRKRLVAAGRQRVKQFSWAKTARETLAVYQEAVNG